MKKKGRSALNYDLLMLLMIIFHLKSQIYACVL